MALAPAEVGLVGDPELLADLGNRLALTGHQVGIAKLLNDLFGRKPLFRSAPSTSVP